MSYSLDLRIRVVGAIEQGTSVTKAAKIYQVGRATIYRWLGREDLKPIKAIGRKRQLDWTALKLDVEQNPDPKLADRAQKFGVSASALCYAFTQMKITRTKTATLSRTRSRRKNRILSKIERSHQKAGKQKSSIY